MIIVRYADDTVIGFEHEGEARRFWDAMRERLREFSLTQHPDKTRLIEFGRLAAQNREKCGLGQAGDLQVPGLSVFSSSRVSFTPGPVCASPSDTRGRRRVPELGSLGSVRVAP